MNENDAKNEDTDKHTGDREIEWNRVWKIQRQIQKDS